MKKFLEEYGKTILSLTIVVVLILISNPVKNQIKVQVDDTIEKFANAYNDKMCEIENLGLKANQVININGEKFVILKHEGCSKYLVMDTDTKEARVFNEKIIGDKCYLQNDKWDYSGCSSKYENSSMDDYLEKEYYNTLSYKEAIVPIKIKQNNIKFKHNLDQYRWWGEEFEQGRGWYIKINNEWVNAYKTKPIKGAIGGIEYLGNELDIIGQNNHYERHVFLPSVKEISYIANLNDQWDTYQLTSTTRG